MSAAGIVKVALGEVGYLEKASNYQLDSKAANAGYNNYTKYGQWYGMNGVAWCAEFVSWCANQAGELSAVGGKFAYCPYWVNHFKSKGQWFAKGAKTPQAGDIIFFGDADHVGIVEYVSDGYVHTIEGNTSSASGLVANGGGVFQKQYALNSSYIMGYGRPAYSGSTTTTTTTAKTTLNGVDISAYQSGINISALSNTDFVIVKATQGTNYTNPYFTTHIDAALAAGKKVGAYHYANGVGATAEAEYFVSVIRPYIGKLALFLDWETGSDSSSKNAAWGNISYAKQWLDRVKELTGVAPLVYTSQSVAAGSDWSSVSGAGYKLWLAQYASMNPINGYKDSPWQSGSVGAFGSYVMHQYGIGYVTGYSGQIDMDKFYGSESDWDAMAGGGLKYKIGWNKDSVGWWWSPDGSTYYVNQWIKYNDGYYYAGSDGYILQDTVVDDNGTKYIFDENGKCTTTPIVVHDNDGDDEMLSYEQWKTYMDQYRKELQDNDAGTWSETERGWAINTGLLKGGDPLPDGSPNYMFQDFLTREQMVVLLYRLNQMIGK